MIVFVWVLFSINVHAGSCSIVDANKLFIEGETCLSFEEKMVENLKATIQKREEYCLLHKDCLGEEETSNINSSEDILRELTTQSLRPLFESIASASQDLDSEFDKGSLNNCSIKQFDSFPKDCQDKLKQINITGEALSNSISEILSKDKNDANQCLENGERLYILSVQGQKNIFDKFSADKSFMKDLLAEKNPDKFNDLVKKKAGVQYEAISSNSRLRLIFSSNDQLKMFIDNNEKLSDSNKKEWASQLNNNCSAVFKKLEHYLCKKVPSGGFVFSDYKLNKNFKLDRKKNFKANYCASNVTELELSDPFDINTANPNYREEVKSSTRSINQTICPLKSKCSAQADPANCLKSECSSIINLSKSELNKAKSLKFQKTFCEDLFDFKNGGAIKNQELVNFLAEKKTPVSINGMLVPRADSKLMNYFITPSKTDDKVAEKPVDKGNVQQVSGISSSINGSSTNNVNPNYNNVGNQQINTNSGQTNNAISNKKSLQEQYGKNETTNNNIDTTDYENTINAQNQLLDRLEKAKNQQTNSNESSDNKTGNSKVKNSNVVTNSPNTGTTTTQGTSVGDSTAPIGTPSPTTTPTSEVGTNKAKTGERNVSSNGNGTSAKGDNTKVNFGSNMDGTTLEAKNNISSSMDVNKEGQYKVTLKNLDPKTLNMELFKDEVKKQAKDAIDKGIPFVISIVNNDKEITINMIPKEKNGKITYVPTPKDDSAESLAFAEKLKNSFHSESKSKTASNVKRSKLSELENNLK